MPTGHFVNTVNRDDLKHAIKMWAVGCGCGTNGIIQQFEYTSEMSTLIPYDRFTEDLDCMIGSRPYGFDIDLLVEGCQSTLDQVEGYANMKCDELIALYESYIRSLNDKFEMQTNPNKIPKH